MESNDPTVDQPRQMNTGLWVIALTVFTIVCGLLICSTLGLGYGVVAVGRSFSTAMASGPAFGTAFAPQPVLTAIAGSATAQVQVQAIATSAAQWSTLTSSTFEHNSEAWVVGKHDGTYGVITRQVANGKFEWELSESKGQFWRDKPAAGQAVSDFSATVEVLHVSGGDYSDYGIVFRQSEDGDHYYFNIRDDDQQYDFSRHYNGKWKSITGWNYSNAIQPGGVNQLTVIASGSHFLFYINGQFVAEAFDATLTSGEVGVGVDQGKTDEVLKVEFDNFELRGVLPTATPTGTPKPTLRPSATLTPVPTTTPFAVLPFAVSGRIVYQSGRDFVYISADGSNRVALTNNQDSSYQDSSPSWSPDGNALVFVRDNALYWLDIDSTQVLPWGNLGLYRVSDPAWAPIGDQVVLVGSTVDGNQTDIVIAQLGFNKYRRVTNSAALKLEPTWSADSSQIVFVTVEKNTYLLEIINTDGTNLRTLTDPVDKATQPDWSPDGEWIAFTAERDDNKEIYLIHPDGTGLKRLTDNVADDFNPTWSPDGQFIAFVSNRDGEDEIYVMRADGTEPTRLTNNIASERDLDWGP